MSATTEKVFIEALALPTRARAALVHKLLVSLEPEEGSPEIEAAWGKEALDRCKAFDEGRITQRDAADVMREAGRKLLYRESASLDRKAEQKMAEEFLAGEVFG